MVHYVQESLIVAYSALGKAMNEELSLKILRIFRGIISGI